MVINRKTMQDLKEEYDLELERVISEIRKTKSKLVLLQFPEGLKPYATVIADYLRERINSSPHSSKGQMNKKMNVEFLIWLGSCYGACDIPIGLEKLKPKIDLTIQFGHNELFPSY